MHTNRRDLLRTVGLAAGVGLAGCADTFGYAPERSGDADSTGTSAGKQGGTSSLELSADVAAAAQLNGFRARLFDAVALGYAGDASGGAALTEATFAAFEAATGEYGVHEFLESTGESVYEGFEGAMTDVRESLAAGDVQAAATAATRAGDEVRSTQRDRLTAAAAAALDVQFFAARAADVAALARTGRLEGARAAATATYEAFENAPSHDALERADAEAYEALEEGLEAAASAATSGDGATAIEHARAAADAAVAGSYAITHPKAAASGEFARYQASAFDAAMLAGMGGPGDGYAHAATLACYRARVHDAARVAGQGATETAATMVQDVFAHFEGARAHEALESADHEAYAGFEGGLEALTTAIEDGNREGVTDAVGQVDTNLVAGIETLAGGNAAVLESVHFEARLADALARYEAGEGDAAAGIVGDLFETFERDELGFHESFESFDHERYEAFEAAMASLTSAFETGDDAGVESARTSYLDALRAYRASVGSGVVGSVATGCTLTATTFDAAATATVGAGSGAASTVETALARFERDEGGFHEALEGADHELYETYETKLQAVREAADGGDVYAAATAFFQVALDATYAVVGAAGGDFLEEANATLSAVFATFEEAQAHDLLESANRDVYEAFETRLDAAIEATGSGEGVDAAIAAFTDSATRAAFAVVDAAGKAPVGESSGSSESSESDPTLSGGPNVVAAPANADHVVKLEAVAFAPAALTVQAGDTVEFRHVAGEAHTVFAYRDELPDGASYWASGGFESQAAAESGWENGEGAVQSGQSYVHTFETTGEHAFYCAPHEAAGMTGRIVVE